MYSFRIKADASDIDIPAVRSLLVVAAIIIIISRNNTVYAVNIAGSILLVAAAFFTEVILVKYRIKPLLVIGVAAVLLALCTYNIIFPVIMIAVVFLVKYFYTPPVVTVADEGVRIKKTFSDNKYEWALFNQVITKDGILSLDFKNNKVLQLELSGSVDEVEFNRFCSQKIATKNSNSYQTDPNQ